MKPEKALEIADDALTKALKISLQARKAFDKKLGRLKLVEEMMRENSEDWTYSRGNEVAVVYECDKWASMLEELQAVIAEIEGDMAFTYEPKKEAKNDRS